MQREVLQWWVEHNPPPWTLALSYVHGSDHCLMQEVLKEQLVVPCRIWG